MRFGPPPPPSSASSLKGKASSCVDAGTTSTTTPRKYVARYVAAKVPSHVVPARRKTNAPATTTSAGAGIGNFKRAVQPAPATTASVAVWNDEQHGEDGKNGDAVNDSENVVPNVPQQDSPVIKFDHGKATANSPVVQHTVGATNAITMLDDVDAIAQRMHGGRVVL